MPPTQHYFWFGLDGWRSRSPVPVCRSPRLHLHPPRHKGLSTIVITRRVKKPIRANSRIKATALTATAANPAPSRSTKTCDATTEPRLKPAQAAAAPGAHDPSALLCLDLSNSAAAIAQVISRFALDRPLSAALPSPPTCSTQKLAVASRMIVRTLRKQMRMPSVPVFHGPHWGFTLECRRRRRFDPGADF